MVTTIVGLVAAAGALAGCGTEVPDQRRLADALFDSGIDRELADCAAAAVVDSLSASELRLLVERGAGAAPVDDPARDDDGADRVRAALSDCRTAAATTETDAEP